MTKQFRGRFECKSDSKGRLSLPSAYRPALDKGNELIVTNALFRGQKCLDVYTVKEWEKLEAKIRKMPQLKAEVQAFQRFYLSSGQAIPVDKQHRFLIPNQLRSYAGLEEDVVLVGMAHKFEVWPAAKWSQLFDDLAGGFDETLAAIADLEGDQ